MKAFLMMVGLASLALGILNSCSKSPATCGPAGFGWALSITDESQALSEAQSAYQQNPTTQNCEKYKKAYHDYYDALKGYEKCLSGAERDSWQDAIEETQDEIDDIQC